MARIRTIKPEFFRHEAIQDLEADNPCSHVMLVFAALWGHCDSNGVFEYRPRQLKLDILPFLDFSMQATLQLLVDAGFVVQYETEGKTYGYIKSFCEHQRLTGKEASEGVKYPFNPSLISEVQSKNSETVGNQQDTNSETLGKHWGSIGEIPDAQEKEREKEREKEGNGVIAAIAPVADATPTPEKPKRPVREKPKSERFEQFWAAYPRKASKPDAQRAWEKHKLDDKAEVIIADVKQRAARHSQWQDPQYIPYPATYLNAQGWHDDVVEAKAKQSAHTGFANKDYSIGATRQDPDEWAASLGVIH